MEDKKPENFDFTFQSAGISLTLHSTPSSDQKPLTVTVTVGKEYAYISLKALTIMVRALNEAKNQHNDGIDTNAKG